MGGGGGTDGANPTGAMPWWVRRPHQTLVENAESFAYGDRGAYQAYPDPRIAGLTDQEQGANQAREDMYNRGDVYGEFGSQQLGLGAQALPGLAQAGFSEFTSDEANRRMNPYIQGVIDPQLRVADQSFDRRLNSDEANSIARGGSIGSYRVNLENAFLEGERAETLGDIQARGLSSAYDQALGSFESDRAAQMGSIRDTVSGYGSLAQSANAVGTGAQAREFGLINEYDRSGAIQRELQQRELDLGYSDFREEQDWPMRNMQFLSGILTGVPTQVGGGATTPQPGLASQLASLGLSAAAIANITG